jgi:ubiquitin carboxyl-terminal hydrolase L5
LADVTFDYENVGAQIQEEAERLAKWKAENERRRHNYVPAIFELLKQLATKNMLDDLYKDAVKRKEEKKATKA